MMTKVEIIMRRWEDTDHVEMDTSGQDKDLDPDLCKFLDALASLDFKLSVSQ